MLESNREGFAVMSSDLKSFSFESERYTDCLRYLHKGDVIARRIPIVIGFGINFYWFSDFCKPVSLKRNRQKNILWLHFETHKNYTHKTGEIIQLCEHPKEYHESYHDETVVCRKCNCMISQFGKTFDIPLPMGVSY